MDQRRCAYAARHADRRKGRELTGRGISMCSMELAASHRRPLPRSEVVGPVDPQERIQVSLYLRRRQNLPAEVSAGLRRLTREERYV